MTQAPGVQNDPLGSQDEAEVHTSEPAVATPGGSQAKSAGQFGALKQDALNRWNVRDRET